MRRRRRWYSSGIEQIRSKTDEETLDIVKRAEAAAPPTHSWRTDERREGDSGSTGGGERQDMEREGLNAHLTRLS